MSQSTCSESKFFISVSLEGQFSFPFSNLLYPKLFIANKKTSRILSTAGILEVFDLHLLGDFFDWTKKGFPFMI